MNENYPVPQELIDLHNEAQAAGEARDSAVKGVFKFQLRNAIYLGAIAIKKRTEFWSKLRELYPDLGESITYNPAAHTVSNIGKKAD